MEIPVLVEPVVGDGYRAHGNSPLALSAEGSTADEALAKFRELLSTHLAGGARIVSVEVPSTKHPLARFAGTLQRDDPLVQSWKEEMAEYRKQVEADADYL